MKVSAKSDWNLKQISAFLTSQVIPIRLSVIDGEFPTICSVWYSWDDDQQNFCCVSHQDSYLVRCLSANPRCAFEVAPNTPPYQGVRGKALVTLQHHQGEANLRQLLDRYLGDSNKGLRQWLLGRANEECLLLIRPTWLTAWDYASRMD